MAWHPRRFVALVRGGRVAKDLEVLEAGEEDEAQALPQLPDDRESRVANPQALDRHRDRVRGVGNDLPRLRPEQRGCGPEERTDDLGTRLLRQPRRFDLGALGQPLTQPLAHRCEHRVDLGRGRAHDLNSIEPGPKRLRKLGRRNADPLRRMR